MKRNTTNENKFSFLNRTLMHIMMTIILIMQKSMILINMIMTIEDIKQNFVLT